ncbi:hypothetical protein AMTRI_Chr10g2140 [Amborella trichopoda]
MKLRHAMVCASNQNRSMEAHALLRREGFDVSSYGTGAHVKLPGPSLREPNVYEFGTPYKQMFDDLRRKDPELYPFHSDLHNREHALMKTVLVINLDVKDNHEEAAVGARLALDLCKELEAAESWDDTIDEIVPAFERQHRRKLLYSISFY